MGVSGGMDGETGEARWSRTSSERGEMKGYLVTGRERAHRFKGLPACPLFKCMLNARGGVRDSLINPLARRTAPCGYFTAVRRNSAFPGSSPGSAATLCSDNAFMVAFAASMLMTGNSPPCR